MADDVDGDPVFLATLGLHDAPRRRSSRRTLAFRDIKDVRAETVAA